MSIEEYYTIFESILFLFFLTSSNNKFVIGKSKKNVNTEKIE